MTTSSCITDRLGRTLKNNILNKRFGKLLVVKFLGSKNKKIYWECQCDCGNTKQYHTAELTKKDRKSCGCFSKNSFVDIQGVKKNNLTAIRFHSVNSSKNRVWEFLCNCGKTIKAEYSDFVTEKIKSCGCLRIQKAKQAKSMYNTAINHKFNQYKHRATKKGIKFELNKEEFNKLVTSPCFYCNTPPDQVKFDYTRNTIALVNGIDKIVNENGYTLKNSVPCCTTCNLAKRNLGVNVFIDWIIKTYTNINENLDNIKKRVNEENDDDF
jgi:hypothetical protein